MTLRLHLVRHAPVIDNKGMVYGDVARIDLDAQKDSIKKLCQSLPSLGEALWYSSGVDRAHRSAEAVIQELGDIGGLKRIGVLVGFREQDFGSLIGKTHQEASNYIQFIDGKIYAPAPPEGENIDELRDRLMCSIKELKKKMQDHEKNDAVVFCHGGTIRAAHVAVYGLSNDRFIHLDTPPLSHHIYDIDHM